MRRVAERGDGVLGQVMFGRQPRRGMLCDPQAGEVIRSGLDHGRRVEEIASRSLQQDRDSLWLEVQVLNLMAPEHMHSGVGLQLRALLVSPEITIDDAANVELFIGLRRERPNVSKPPNDLAAAATLEEPVDIRITADGVEPLSLAALAVAFDIDEAKATDREGWRTDGS